MVKKQIGMTVLPAGGCKVLAFIPGFLTKTDSINGLGNIARHYSHVSACFVKCIL